MNTVSITNNIINLIPEPIPTNITSCGLISQFQSLFHSINTRFSVLFASDFAYTDKEMEYFYRLFMTNIFSIVENNDETNEDERCNEMTCDKNQLLPMCPFNLQIRKILSIIFCQYKMSDNDINMRKYNVMINNIVRLLQSTDIGRSIMNKLVRNDHKYLIENMEKKIRHDVAYATWYEREDEYEDEDEYDYDYEVEYE